jgi:pimeloyl-ACP methyl ester carboxylesterase/lysophospholipase L1-like esterase
MIRNLKSLLFLLALFSGYCLIGQSNTESILETPIKESYWKGFKRYDLKFNQRDARLVLPENPLPGNPWIWRARFPNWHTEADSILVSEGFHLAYINTNNQYGSPNAISIWDDYYDFLTTEYKLNKKVALIGVSRGGLFVYNWAKKNPDKVSCIYAEAPVCDFKSWPAGFGESEGSSRDWELLKKEYGFDSDEEAKQYANNPIDNPEALAQAKIPVLHTIGLDDKIVPVHENTLPFINKYIQLGGTATVIPCTEGEQGLQGHHFPIESPEMIADFIKYHSLKEMPLNASDYHHMRNDLKNSQIKFSRNRKGRVAFLGGSITYNPGWRDSISDYLVKRFPEIEFEFINAGIPSMGTTPAAFRLERDVLSHGTIDLLFVEAAVNDATNRRTEAEQIRGMEGVIRQLLRSNPEIDIVMMHFVDPGKIESYNNGVVPEVITNHNKVAQHYNISTINLAKEVTDRINNNEFTWEDDFKNLHPSPFGQGVYSYSMIQFLSNAYSGHIDPDDKIVSRDLPSGIHPFAYDKGQLLDVSEARFSKNWHIDSNWNPNDGAKTRSNYVNVPMLIGNVPGSSLKFKFKGSTIGIAVAAGPDAGFIEYRIDKGEWKELNLFTRYSKNLHLPWFYTLSSGLSEKEHLLEIRISGKKDERSSGNACRIRYFYVNKY